MHVQFVHSNFMCKDYMFYTIGEELFEYPSHDLQDVVF